MDVALLVGAEAPQDTLGLTPYQQWNASGGDPSALFYRLGDGFLVRFPDVADFRLPVPGLVATCTPVPGAGDRWQPIYQQQVLPLLASMRGEPVYHGASVALGDEAVVILGESGQGKSTLAAAFASRGHPFLADDCIRLVEDGGLFRVEPDLASIRLWDDSIEAVAPASVEARHATGSPKPHLEAGPELPHCERSLPLRRVYVLADADDAPRLSPLSPAELALAWMRHAFVLDIKSPEVLRANLARAARLGRAVSGATLAYPRRYESLDAVVATVVADAAEAGWRSATEGAVA